MRRALKVVGWIGCGLSTLLLAATVILWVRSLGYQESWMFVRFERATVSELVDRMELGISRDWHIRAENGRLWLASRTWTHDLETRSGTYYRREPISADVAKRVFNSTFQPGVRPWESGTQRAWRFAGGGFCRMRNAVDPRIGQPRYEGTYIAIPFWMLAVVFGLWPTIVIVRRLLRKKRYAAGCCPQCGYDLRATPDPAGPRVDRCPECGRAVAATGK